MSINSINQEDMTTITSHWDEDDMVSVDTKRPAKQVKSAEARRRIEMLREIQESGLTIEEAKELGLIH